MGAQGVCGWLGGAQDSGRESVGGSGSRQLRAHPQSTPPPQPPPRPQGGLGPMQGQADWWLLFAPERNEAAITRYLNETERLFGCGRARQSQPLPCVPHPPTPCMPSPRPSPSPLPSQGDGAAAGGARVAGGGSVQPGRHCDLFMGALPRPGRHPFDPGEGDEARLHARALSHTVTRTPTHPLGLPMHRPTPTCAAGWTPSRRAPRCSAASTSPPPIQC